MDSVYVRFVRRTYAGSQLVAGKNISAWAIPRQGDWVYLEDQRFQVKKVSIRYVAGMGNSYKVEYVEVAVS